MYLTQRKIERENIFTRADKFINRKKKFSEIDPNSFKNLSENDGKNLLNIFTRN